MIKNKIIVLNFKWDFFLLKKKNRNLKFETFCFLKLIKNKYLKKKIRNKILNYCKKQNVSNFKFRFFFFNKKKSHLKFKTIILFF